MHPSVLCGTLTSYYCSHKTQLAAVHTVDIYSYIHVYYLRVRNFAGWRRQLREIHGDLRAPLLIGTADLPQCATSHSARQLGRRSHSPDAERHC